ncbi:MAG: hypothetical protein F4Y49_11190 [Dehalococcoidia bacterium]|nr:hypothetical protein [Dehalococcoidia bacterium]
MSDSNAYGPESTDVQTHLQIMQGVIQRMADNSRSCKVWCVTLVSAILVLVARTGKADHILIALAPTVLFLVLDAYYLGLEQGFRASYNAFVAKVHKASVSTTDLFTVETSGPIPRHFLSAVFRSFSVLPFYVTVAATTVIAWQLVL